MDATEQVDEARFDFFPITGTGVHLPNGFDTQVTQGVVHRVEVPADRSGTVVADVGMVFKEPLSEGAFSFSYVQL